VDLQPLEAKVQTLVAWGLYTPALRLNSIFDKPACFWFDMNTTAAENCDKKVYLFEFTNKLEAQVFYME
jgi:hypothetical protein